jgi:hypothetical protein
MSERCSIAQGESRNLSVALPPSAWVQKGPECLGGFWPQGSNNLGSKPPLRGFGPVVLDPAGGEKKRGKDLDVGFGPSAGGVA